MTTEPMGDRTELESLMHEAAKRLGEGRESEAIACYDRILAEHPKHADALCMRGVALRMLGLKTLEAAGRDFESAQREDPSFAKPHFQAIRLARTLERLDGTIKAYKLRIIEDRVNPRNYAYLAFSLLMAGDAENALEIVQTGLAIGPTDAYLHYTHGEILHARGDRVGAIEAWRRAWAHDTAMVDAVYALAEAYEEGGETESAAATWGELLEILRAKGAPPAQCDEIAARMGRLGVSDHAVS